MATRCRTCTNADSNRVVNESIQMRWQGGQTATYPCSNQSRPNNPEYSLMNESGPTT